MSWITFFWPFKKGTSASDRQGEINKVAKTLTNDQPVVIRSVKHYDNGSKVVIKNTYKE